MITKLLPLTLNKAEILFEIYASKQAYLREIARALKKNPSLCKKSINALYKSGAIKKVKSGQLIYYSLEQTYETGALIRLLDEFYLEKMSARSAKLKALINLARSNDGLKEACSGIYVFGSYARGIFTERSDVDMLFITSDKSAVSKFAREASILISAEINGITMTEDEFRSALNKKEPLTASIVENPKARLIVWQ